MNTRIIPAIDVINGKCVRLTKGDFNTQKIYNENPVEVAKQFEDFGIKYLHLVDLDGAKSKRIINYKVLEQIASKTRLEIDFGGGIQSDEDIAIAFNSGAYKVTGGSIAVKNSELFLNWLAKYGAEKIILGADAKDRKIVTHGWMENSETDVLDFIKHFEQKGIQSVICTDVAKDGMLQGVSEKLYRDIRTETNVKLIASGGVSSIDDLLIVNSLGCDGVIIGKAIYENKISLKELQNFI